MDYQKSINDFIAIAEKIRDDFIAFLPKLVFAIIVLLIGYFVARLVKVLVRKFLRYLNKVINEQLKARFLNVDLASSANFIARVFYWLIFVVTITLVTEIIELPVITVWLSELVQYLPNLLAAIIIIIVGLVVGKLVADVISTAADRTGIIYGEVLGKISRYAIILISIVIAIDQVGINIDFLTNLVDIVLAAILFGAGLAFGLGAKTSVSNILAAYYVMKSYREGDTIRIGDIEGKIIRINPTHVILATQDGQTMIPTKQFSESQSTLIKKH